LRLGGGGGGGTIDVGILGRFEGASVMGEGFGTPDDAED